MIKRVVRAEGALLLEGFTAVPNVVLRDITLTPHARLLYALMLDLAWRKEDPAHDDLGRLVGITEKPVRAALKQLREKGLVTVTRRGQGKPNTYIVREPQNGSYARSRTGAKPATPLKDAKEHRDVEANASTSPTRTPQTRAAIPRDIAFDALAEVTHANPSATGHEIGNALTAIHAAMTDDGTLDDLTHTYLERSPEADEVPAEIIFRRVAEEIVQRASEYARCRPDWELTPSALAKHWNRIPTWKTKRGKMTAADIAGLDEAA